MTDCVDHIDHNTLILLTPNAAPARREPQVGGLAFLSLSLTVSICIEWNIY